MLKNFDRDKCMLVVTKYMAYLINAVIVMAVVFGIYSWVQLLIASAK